MPGAEGADLAVFPELCVPGYPAEDLYLKRHFIEANRRAVEEIAAGVEGIVALVGFAEPAAGGGDFRHAHNALAVLADGAVRSVYRKNRLPNYAVFDEQRYFIPGTEAATVDVAGARVGLTVCEDCWVEGPPASTEVAEGATLIANPSGSPYHRGKGREREALFASLARSYGVHFAFCNLVGGQDELVFDGQSLVLDPSGGVLARAAQFEEELLVCDLASPAARRPRRRAAPRPRRGLRGAGPRPARLRRQERLPPRRPGPLGGHRLGPRRAARGRRARRRSRHLRGHALPSFQLCNTGGRTNYRREPRRRGAGDPDRGGDGRYAALSNRHGARGDAATAPDPARPSEPTSPRRTSRRESAAT